MDFGEVEGLEAGKGGEVEEEWKESVFSAGFPPTTDVGHLQTTEPRKPMNTTLEVDITTVTVDTKSQFQTSVSAAR